MQNCRRWAAFLLALLLALAGAAPGLAETPDDYNKNIPQVLVEGHLYADAALLMDAESGNVLFAKNARERMYPASTTKIMTLLLALESGISMDTPIVIPQQAAQIPMDSSLVPVFPGDQMTFRDLLYGFMLSSGNDGANAVAVLCSGSLDKFVERMNERAVKLGCTDTHFANPHGYHNADHYTTAQDMARIVREAVKQDAFRQIVSTQSYTMSIQRGRESVSTRVVNTNALLNSESRYYYEYCIGIKTGYHSAAGQCFVGAAERDGVRLIAVDFHAPASYTRWVDTIRLFDYGFTRYNAYTLEQMYSFAGSRIATLKISNAAEDDPQGGEMELRIAQVSNPNYTRMVEINSEAAMEAAIDDFVSRSELTITGSMTAPVSEGEIMGKLRYVAQSGEEITALLIAGRDVAERRVRASITDLIPALRVFENSLVRMFAASVLLLIVLLLIAGAVRRARKERLRKRIYEVRKEEYLRQQRVRNGRHTRFDEYDDDLDDDSDDDPYDDY